MTQQAAGFVRIEHHRHGLGFHLARIEPGHGLFARFLADGGGGSQIAGMPRGGMVVIALHAGAFARQHGDADGMAGAGITAKKAGRGGQRDGIARIGGAAAFRIGDTGNRQAGAFRVAGPADQGFGRRLDRIFQIEGGNVARQQVCRRQAGEFVLRRQARHRQGAAGQGGNGIGGKIGGGDKGDPLADENAQAQIVAFAAFDIFQIAQPVGDAGGELFHQQGVGGVGAGLFGGVEQGLKQNLRIAVGHDFSMPGKCRAVKRRGGRCRESAAPSSGVIRNRSGLGGRRRLRHRLAGRGQMYSLPSS